MQNETPAGMTIEQAREFLKENRAKIRAEARNMARQYTHIVDQAAGLIAEQKQAGKDKKKN